MGQNWQRKARDQGVKGKRVKNRAEMEKEISNEKIKGRSRFGYKPIRDDSNKKYGGISLFLCTNKSTVTHPIYKGNDQFPDQAANVTYGSHGERGVPTPLVSEIRT